MSAAEIKLYDIFRNDLKLSDAKARMFAEVIQETVINEVNHQQTEFKSNFREDFYKMEIKIEQLNSKMDIKTEQLNSKIEATKVDLIKWFIGLFFALALMIVGLYLKK